MDQDLLGGRYRLRRVLGRGGMAVVWQADDERLGRPVAVKVLDRAGLTDRSALARFDREARTVAGLAHPNVVTVHDVGIDDGVPYLVMELVDGQSLAEVLTRGPLDVGEAVRIAGQICTALEAAHAAGVVHRDVKPANILITAAGVAKVCDFGIAHGPHGAQTSLTGPAIAVGTSEYMAPEQVAGGPVDRRTDLYGLGCVLYAMLTGHPPFSGDTPIRVVWQHLHESPTPVAELRAGVPAELSGLVDQLLAKDPADRPASAAEVKSRLPHLSGVSSPTLVAPVVGAGAAGAAGQSGTPIRGSAAVPSRTQMMPALDYVDAPPARSSSSLSPGWKAVMALGAVAIVVLAIIALTRGTAQPQAGSPPATPATSAQPSSTPPPSTTSAPPSNDSPEGVINALQGAIQAQALAGQIDRDTAHDLSDQLGEIAQRFDHDNGHKTAGKFNDFRNTINDARDNDKISNTAYSALAPLVDQLANLLPGSDQNNND